METATPQWLSGRELWIWGMGPVPHCLSTTGLFPFFSCLTTSFHRVLASLYCIWLRFVLLWSDWNWCILQTHTHSLGFLLLFGSWSLSAFSLFLIFVRHDGYDYGTCITNLPNSLYVRGWGCLWGASIAIAVYTPVLYQEEIWSQTSSVILGWVLFYIFTAGRGLTKRATELMDTNDVKPG